MAAFKQVKVKVDTEENLAGVEAIEVQLKELNKQRIQLQIDAKTEELSSLENKIKVLKTQINQIKDVSPHIKANIDMGGVEYLKSQIKTLERMPPHIKAQFDVDKGIENLKQQMREISSLDPTVKVNIEKGGIDELEAEIANLQDKSAKLQLDVEKGELEQAKAEIEDMDGEEIEVQLRNQSAMEAIDQIGQGFDRLKQGASEVGQQMGELLDKAGEAEQNKAFLEIGFNKAGSKQAEKDAIDAQKRIQDIVAKAPGDDTAMNSILSSAVAKDVKLMDKDMQGFADSVSDYFAGAEVNGKHAAEAIQDVRSYITSGNVAELETTGIFDQSQLDQLKDIDDVGERVAKFQEMVNQSSYAGLGTADTLNNKWAEFGGMMDKSRTQLGGFFTDATKGTLDWILNLNDATGGLAGMGLALVQMASPVTDVFMGLGQMATGMKAIKDLGFIKWLKDLEIANKFAKISQLELNLAFLTNPIFLVVAAIVALILILGYLYFNNEQVRAAVDGLGQSLLGLGQWIYSGAIYWLDQLRLTLENLWNYIFTLGGLIPANVSLTGNQIMDTILRVILFMATLPFQIGMIFLKIIAKALGFGDNFTQRMIKSASDAVKGFLQYIQRLPGIVMGEFNRVLGLVNDFINSLPSRVWDMGTAIIDALKKSLGIGSPGHMFYMIEGEFKRIDDLTQKTRFDTGRIGRDMVDNFNPVLGVGLDYKDTANALFDAKNKDDKEPTVINFYFNDTVVDNEQRMERIADFITRKLMFDNAKAGRTV